LHALGVRIPASRRRSVTAIHHREDVMARSDGIVMSLRLLSVVFACITAFFIFYTVRLLLVTGGLQATRPGGQGAYVGAVVFPLFAIGCAWVSWRCFSRARRMAAGRRSGR
ncbi:MAG: hypothetical protein ABI969_15100, partial [bacterium]